MGPAWAGVMGWYRGTPPVVGRMGVLQVSSRSERGLMVWLCAVDRRATVSMKREICIVVVVKIF
jgi:hypothetical protein